MTNRLPDPPADYATTLRLSRAYNLQYPGDSLTVTSSTSAATGYEVRRLEPAGGTTLVASGAWTGDGHVLGSAGSGTYAPYGHYTLRLTGPDRGDGQYATDYGTCRFVIAEDVATIPQSPLWPATGTPPQYQLGLVAFLAHGLFSLGGYRLGPALTTTNASTVVTNLTNNLDTWWTYWGQYGDTVRPRRVTIALLTSVLKSQLATYMQAATDVVSGLTNVRPTFVAGFTSRNEPQANYDLAEGQQFAAAVHAGNAAAKAIGPDFVSLGLQADGAPKFFTLADQGLYAAGGLDRVSYHQYNMDNNDLAGVVRPVFTNLKAGMAARGLPTSDMFMTEGGSENSWKTNAAGVSQKPANLLLRKTGSAYMLAQLSRELILGVPYENTYVYYDMRGGFDDVPMWQASNSGPYAAWPMQRAFAREVYHKAVVGEYDLGDAAGAYLAGHWLDPDTGDGVAAFIAAGPGLPGFVCDVSGAATVTAVDCFGNASTLTVTGGTVTVPAVDVPTYVRIPLGVTFTPRPVTWGTNLLGATGWTYADSGDAASTGKTKMTDGSRTTAYAYSSTDLNLGSGYYAADGVYPRQVDILKSSGSITANTLAIFCPAPWQKQPALMDFDVQVRVGGSWVTKATYTQTTATVRNFDVNSDTRVDQYTEAQHTFLVDLGGATVLDGVRLNIRAGSYGMYLDDTLKLNPGTAAVDGQVSQALQVQSVEAYLATAAAPPAVIKYVVRNIA